MAAQEEKERQVVPETIPDHELTVESLAKKTFMRPEQRQDLQRSIDSQQERLTNPIILELTGGDPEAVRKQVAKETEMLARGAPPKLGSAQLAKVHRLEAMLRERITHAIPTYGMMERARPTDVDHHVAWERQHKRDVLAWKACLQILDPNNTEPNFLSIARLRSDTVKGDPRKYTQNFDTIKWAETIEEDLVRDMDDSVYHRFLEYKVLGWSKPSICKELHFSDKMYEAALERLRRSMQGKQEPEDEADVTWAAEDEADDQPAAPTESEDPEEPQDDARPLRRSERQGTIFEGPQNRFAKKPREERPKMWLHSTLNARGMSFSRFCDTILQRTDKKGLRKQDQDGVWIVDTLAKVEEALQRVPEQRPERPLTA